MNCNENVSPAVVQRVMKELRTLMRRPLDGITIHVDESKVTTFVADFDGPVGTPYEKGLFRAQLTLSHDFPQTPPKGTFLTKIFHPNVASNGDICVNTLKRDWKSSHGFGHVLSIIRCLLIHPNPASALNEEAGRLLMESYDEYARRARIFTKIHARKRTNDSSSHTQSPRRTRAHASGGEGTGSRARHTVLSSRSERARSPFSDRNSAEKSTPRSSRSPSHSRDALASSTSPGNDGYSSDEQDENDGGYSDDGYSDDESTDSAVAECPPRNGEAEERDGYSDDEDDEEEDGENSQSNAKATSSGSLLKGASHSSSTASCHRPYSISSSLKNTPTNTSASLRSKDTDLTASTASTSHVHPRAASPAIGKEASLNARQLRPKRKKLRL